MTLRLLVLITALVVFSNCSSTPTPTSAPTAPAPTSVPTTAPTNAPTTGPTATQNAFGLNFVAQYDPTRQVLTIFGTTPGATIVFGGTALQPPPTPTASLTAPPTNTPIPSPTILIPTVSLQPTQVVAPTRIQPTFPPQPTRAPATRAPQPTSSPVNAAPLASVAALKGKILFKTDRDGGVYPNVFSYYAMNGDGSGLQPLDYRSAHALAIDLQGREGYAPDRSRVVLSSAEFQRFCIPSATCALFILDPALQARMIGSNEPISTGLWFRQRGYQAKDPVWSPAGNSIAFVSNHDADAGCIRTPNIFKGTPTQNPTLRRLTSGPDFCAGANSGHPSFNPDGSQLAFWNESRGSKQIYVLVSNVEDFRFSNPHIISDGRASDWDPLWIK